MAKVDINLVFMPDRGRTGMTVFAMDFRCGLGFLFEDGGFPNNLTIAYIQAHGFKGLIHHCAFASGDCGGEKDFSCNNRRS